MGSGVSTTKVDRIRIDQNGDIWKQKKDGTEKLCKPPSAKSDRVRGSAGSTRSKKDNEQGVSTNLQKSRSEALEARLKESEQSVSLLQHEISLLELRNTELADEVRWLRDQIHLTRADEDDEFQNVRQRASISDNETDIGSVKAKAKLERGLYENLIIKLQNELKEDQEKHNKKLQFEQDLREKMEDVVRIHLGDSFLYDAKNSLAHDVLPVSKTLEKPLCRTLLSSYGRLSTPQHRPSDSVETIREEHVVSDVQSDDNCTSTAEVLNLEKDNDNRPSTSHVDSVHESTRQMGNGESAPVPYRRSKSRENRRLMRKKREVDKESICSIDDEIDDLLNSSFSSLSVNSHKIRENASAKSRDSGYLGESGHFELKKMP